MAKHQMIYTSCKKGIQGEKDGLQLFSHDSEVKKRVLSAAKPLFEYHPPKLEDGQFMTDDLVGTMPSVFQYRLLKHDLPAVAMTTYLGRDYTGSTGEFGNYLSHVIVTDEEDFNCYPAELYHSPAFRTSMDPEEVNNDTLPEFLPTPELTPGDVINFDSVAEFLKADNRLEPFKKMVHAMLSHARDDKTVVICDDQENLIFWMAGLHYILPLSVAKKVNFTTYEANPKSSEAILCGVVPTGTQYDCDSFIDSKYYYVFDFKANQFSDVIVEEPAFSAFIDKVFNGDKDALVKFHYFIMDQTSYRHANDHLYYAYQLHRLISEGVQTIEEEDLADVIKFAKKYANKNIIGVLITHLAKDLAHMDQLPHEDALMLMDYMIEGSNPLTEDEEALVQEMAIRRFLVLFNEANIEEAEFNKVYDHLYRNAVKVGLDVPATLMSDQYRPAVVEALEKDAPEWKLNLITDLMVEHYKEAKMGPEAFSKDVAVGQFYTSVLNVAFGRSPEEGKAMLQHLLNAHGGSSSDVTALALSLEGDLNQLDIPEEDKAELWNSFFSKAEDMKAKDLKVIEDTLISEKRYDEMYRLFDQQLRSLKDVGKMRKFFNAHWDNWINTSPEYSKAYAYQVLGDYTQLFVDNLGKLSKRDSLDYGSELLHRLMSMSVKDDNVRVILEKVVAVMPFEKMTTPQKDLINELYTYQTSSMNEAPDGKLLLIWAGNQLSKIGMRESIASKVEDIKKAGNITAPIDLAAFDSKDLDRYFEWVFTGLAQLHLLVPNYQALHQFFAWTDLIQSQYFEFLAKHYIKDIKKHRDYNDFFEFLSFMMDTGQHDDEKAVGQQLSQLHKDRLEEMTTEAEAYFASDETKAKKWNYIKLTARQTNPIFNKITGFFKKR